MLTNSSIRTLCWNVFMDKSTEMFINIFCTFIISFINFGLRQLLLYLKDYSRYDTKTSEATSLFNNLFLSTFINTSFLLTLVYANIFDFIPMKIITSFLPFIHYTEYSIIIKFIK